MAKYFLIAGEASGDAHAAALVRQIRLRDPQAQTVALGGDLMQAAGCKLYLHIRQMAFMGFVAVAKNWRTVRNNFRIAQQALLAEKPDVLILVDYPSFNLRMARFCRKKLPGTRICYYIPPKVWAWKRRRIHAVARLCDEVLGIFPFEPAFYARYSYQCTYVGNPTVEETRNRNCSVSPQHGRRPFIALLPGSRPSEVLHCLPRMLEAARRFRDYDIVVTAAPGLDDTFYASFLQDGETLTRNTYAAVQSAAAAVVNSGTATLETAFIGCPQVAVYHLAFSRLLRYTRWWLQPLCFSIKWFTPVNIAADKEIIRECIADTFTVDNVAAELQRLLTDDAYKKEMLAAYKHLLSLFGTQSASATAAAVVTSRP